MYSDHNLVMAKAGLRLKKITRRDCKKKWNMIGLANKKEQFQTAVELEIKKVKDYGVRGINKEWSQIKEAITIGAKEVYGFQKARIAKKSWITSEMLHKLNERRNWKNNESEYGQRNIHD